jgi:hypothetical protein
MPVAPWIESVEIPPSPSPVDIRTFFGVPPDPDDRLDRNISRKRRHWKSKTRERVASERAQRKVAQALRIIDALEQQLKRGVVDEDLDLEKLREEFTADPETVVDELADLWRILEELLAGGRLDEALRVANDARERFSGATQADAAFGWLAAIASRIDETATEALRKEGIAALRTAIDGGERNSDTYMWCSVLQIDVGEPGAALQTLGEAERRLNGGLTPWLFSHRCEAHAALGRAEDAARDALRAVSEDTDDLALRSNTVSALIRAMREAYLPITSDDVLRRYQDLVELAAWCAIGAPEAEDRIRPFRLWAVEAESRAYVGRIEWRSIIAVVTGFVALPLLNRARSRPHWRVFLDGPTKANGEMFGIVALADIPRFVHDGLMHKVGWKPEDHQASGA